MVLPSSDIFLWCGFAGYDQLALDHSFSREAPVFLDEYYNAKKESEYLLPSIGVF